MAFISRLISQFEVQNVTSRSTIFTEFLPIYRKISHILPRKYFLLNPLPMEGLPPIDPPHAVLRSNVPVDSPTNSAIKIEFHLLADK